MDMPKHQRSSSVSNGRVWTEEEEQYLLDKRREKMPYKHIAAHLGKTDLACRLHYHHLTHGVNRRRKGLASSASPRNSPRVRHASLSMESSGSRSMTPDVIQLELPSLIIPPSASLPPRPQRPLLFPSQVRLPLKTSVETYQMTAQQFTTFPQATYNALPPASFSTASIPHESDFTTLQSVYDQHKSTFWDAITEYGLPTSPVSMVRAQ